MAIRKFTKKAIAALPEYIVCFDLHPGFYLRALEEKTLPEAINRIENAIKVIQDDVYIANLLQKKANGKYSVILMSRVRPDAKIIKWHTRTEDNHETPWEDFTWVDTGNRCGYLKSEKGIINCCYLESEKNIINLC